MININYTNKFIYFREIAFVREINKIDANIKWYYLGFYVHSCKKMRYKVKFLKIIKKIKN